MSTKRRYATPIASGNLEKETRDKLRQLLPFGDPEVLAVRPDRAEDRASWWWTRTAILVDLSVHSHYHLITTALRHLGIYAIRIAVLKIMAVHKPLCLADLYDVLHLTILVKGGDEDFDVHLDRLVHLAIKSDARIISIGQIIIKRVLTKK